MVMFGYIQPTNKLIAYAQTEVPMQELYAEVATIKPAHLVMRGTTDSDILLATMETKPPLGIAGYEQSFLGCASYTSQRPATIDTAYANGAKVPVLSGTNFVLPLRLAANFAVVKGDRLCSFTDGTVAPYVPVGDGFALKIPFTKQVSAKDTGIDLPAGVVITGAFIDVTTEISGSHIDVGFINAVESGDEDGLIDGAATTAAGMVAPINYDAAAAAGLTCGDYIATEVTTGGTVFFGLPKDYVCNGTIKSLSYTTSNHAVVGNIFVVVRSRGIVDVGRAEKTLAKSTSEQDIMAMVNI